MSSDPTCRAILLEPGAQGVNEARTPNQGTRVHPGAVATVERRAMVADDAVWFQAD